MAASSAGETAGEKMAYQDVPVDGMGYLIFTQAHKGVYLWYMVYGVLCANMIWMQFELQIIVSLGCFTNTTEMFQIIIRPVLYTVNGVLLMGHQDRTLVWVSIPV